MADLQELRALEAKVVELQRKVDLVMQHLGLHYVDPAPQGQAEILALLREGKTIEAIRVYRERTGASLKDAKDAVEAIQVGQPSHPGKPPYR